MSKYKYQTRVVGKRTSASTYNTQEDCDSNDCWNSTGGSDGQIDTFMNGGVAILSKWPIVYRAQRIFNSAESEDKYSRKGFAYVKLDVNGSFVHVIGTHLQAGGGEANKAARTSQLEQIAQFVIDQEIPYQEDIIYGGDFNIRYSNSCKPKSKSEYCRMIATLRVKSPKNLFPNGKLSHDGSANQINLYKHNRSRNREDWELDHSSQLDYVFFRPGSQRDEEDWGQITLPVCYPQMYQTNSKWQYVNFREYSDHYPVIAGFNRRDLLEEGAEFHDLKQIYNDRNRNCEQLSYPTFTPKAYGRGVGKPIHACRDNEEKDGLLCYPKCESGFAGVGPVCWKSCPSGFRDDGAYCYKSKSYGRGAGKPMVCAAGKQYDAGLCYNYCKSGYTGVGPVCWKSKCKSGYANHGATCYKNLISWYKRPSYGRGVGKPVSTCRAGEEKDGLLCYPICKTGTKGVGPMCWSGCPSGFKDIGVSCQKPSSGRGAGKPLTCAQDEEYDAGLCYDKCKSGYNGVGPVCWRNED